jgi:hypothetical protein
VSYSPHLRTAVLLTGSGTAGAYHAGALRALHEAGIKIDVMSGRGVGVVGALFAAIDAASKTWEEGGLWRRRPAVRLYRWRPALRWAGIFLLLAIAVLALPLVVLATGLMAYPLSFLVQMVSVDSGYRLAAAYSAMIDAAFAPDALPTVIPRLITLCLAVAFLILAAAAIRTRSVRQIPDTIGIGKPDATMIGHRDRGRWWTRLVATPWSTEPGLRHYRELLWQLFRGPTNARQPGAVELSRRYAELLHENLGQPGFRELIVTTVDLETRTDLIFAMLAGPRRQGFFHRSPSGSRSGAGAPSAGWPIGSPFEKAGDLIDLSGIGRNQVLDALAGSMSLPVITEPHPVVFSPESYWKGETHRTCDRPSAVGRLFHELSIAGVEQIIVVSAAADRSAPHRLNTPIGTLSSRLAEHLSAAEHAAVRDAIAGHRAHFRGVFLIQPAHNPMGPFDFGGTYDERSDRYRSVPELVDRGYEDAYRQFIEPVVGD